MDNCTQMVDLQISNEKLRDRARRVVRSAVSESTARDISSDAVLDAILASCDDSVKLAIFIIKSGCSPDEGKAILSANSGDLRVALQAGNCLY